MIETKPFRLDWLGRIQAAQTRGGFDITDISDASRFSTSPVEEVVKSYNLPKNSIWAPDDAQLAFLGVHFANTVARQDFSGAIHLHEKIWARGSEIAKATQAVSVVPIEEKLQQLAVEVKPEDWKGVDPSGNH